MARRKGEAESKIILPITPMLDMTFQLLFFFIVNFHPADLEGQIEMALPSEDIKQAHDQKNVNKQAAPEKDPDPQFQADLTVKVRTQGGENSTGGISGIFVSSIGGKDEPIPGRDERELLAGLKKYLDEKVKTLTNKEGIKVMGDSKLRIKHLMRVMDVCRRAGFEKVSMVPGEDFGR